MTTRRFVVTGRVQGVGFRFFCVRKAESLGVRGVVWNREDGAVEGIAQHQLVERLTLFLGTLRVGPGNVDNVEVIDELKPSAFGGFSIVVPPIT